MTCSRFIEQYCFFLQKHTVIKRHAGLKVSKVSLPLTLCTRACHLVNLNLIDCSLFTVDLCLLFLFTVVLWSIMLCDHFDGITVDSHVYMHNIRSCNQADAVGC